MPVSVDIEGVGTVEFPDSMDEKSILDAIQKDIVPKAPVTKSLQPVLSESELPSPVSSGKMPSKFPTSQEAFASMNPYQREQARQRMLQANETPLIPRPDMTPENLRDYVAQAALGPDAVRPPGVEQEKAGVPWQIAAAAINIPGNIISAMSTPEAVVTAPLYLNPITGPPLMAYETTKAGAQTLGKLSTYNQPGVTPPPLHETIEDIVNPLLMAKFTKEAGKMKFFEPEKIQAVAVRAPEGEILTGPLGTRHNEIARAADIPEPPEKDRGFLIQTPEGEKTVLGTEGRKEALPIAEEAGQVKPESELSDKLKDLKDEGELHGEMTKPPATVEELANLKAEGEVPEKFGVKTFALEGENPETVKARADLYRTDAPFGLDLVKQGGFEIRDRAPEMSGKEELNPTSAAQWAAISDARKGGPEAMREWVDEAFKARREQRKAMSDFEEAKTDAEKEDAINRAQTASNQFLNEGLQAVGNWGKEFGVDAKTVAEARRLSAEFSKGAEDLTEPAKEVTPIEKETQGKEEGVLTTPSSVSDILGEHHPDVVEATLGRWIDRLASPPGLLADPFFVQTIGRPAARLALIAAREVYRTGKNVLKAIDEGIKWLKEHVERFDETEARAWLKTVLPTAAESSKLASEERASLKEVLSKSQAAGKAGFKAGYESAKPVIQKLSSQLNDSISKAAALSEHLRGMEKGSKIGGRASREDAERIDRWLAADSKAIGDSLNELADNLPLSERGRFNRAIQSAMQRPSLYDIKTKAGGEVMSAVEAMYFKAAKVGARIENRIEEVHLKDLQEQIEKFDRFKDSPSIDVPYRQQIRLELENARNLIKNKALTPDTAQAFIDRLTSLKDIGKSEQTVKKAIWEWQKEFAENRLKQTETTPINKRPQFMPTPGDPTPFSMRLRNWVNRRLNDASTLDKATLVMDALFDLMDGGHALYNGWLHRDARAPVDLALNEVLVEYRKKTQDFENFLLKNGLKEENGRKIGVLAATRQNGGLNRLIEGNKIPEADIHRILKELTPKEIEAYDRMQQSMESKFPEIEDLMRRLYNTEVKPVENYFPMRRDHSIVEPEPKDLQSPSASGDFDSLAGLREFLDDLQSRQKHTTEKGFTIERQPGAATAIRTDAFDIYREHMFDVIYQKHMQPILKRLGEIKNGDVFKERYGDVGKVIFGDWLDTLARNGNVELFKRWRKLDALRRNLSLGVIGLDLSSQLVHASNVPYIYTRIGNWFNTGIREVLSDRGQEFVRNNFAETIQRSGGEPGQAEIENAKKLYGGLLPKPAVNAAFGIARMIDRFNSQAGALGTYLMELKNKGLDWRNYDKIPVDKEAQARALVTTRRAFASPLPKDVAQAISRGRLTGGNVSVGRTLFHFSNIPMDQWSNLRLDLYEAGLKSADLKNPVKTIPEAMLKTVPPMVAFLTSIILETGIKESVKSAWSALFSSGKPDKKKQDDAYYQHVLREGVRRIPLGSLIASQVAYGRSGIPVLDAFMDVSKNVKLAATAKKPETQRKAAIRAISGAAQIAGVPGARQAEEIYEAATK